MILEIQRTLGVRKRACLLSTTKKDEWKLLRRHHSNIIGQLSRQEPPRVVKCIDDREVPKSFFTT